ncbi:methyltransferase domain-containing protein [Fimicolochytrium jonesii]|uniref:methyltransferase domain-containing protein n=1 Tax=Fimicolochytrium jonesii TaxID=1396493 RepID=UPI0022FDE921|nr:methyltransferase domain-containing protein [Fimicolochytrium jonesii]KAI8818227.1 methyltransferase domain-containing protein [Fimicolochytrium jonesii]
MRDKFKPIVGCMALVGTISAFFLLSDFSEPGRWTYTRSHTPPPVPVVGNSQAKAVVTSPVAAGNDSNVDAYVKCLTDVKGNRDMYDVEKCISDIRHGEQLRLMDKILELPRDKLSRYTGTGAYAYVSRWKIFDLFKPVYECNALDLLRIGAPSKVSDTGKWLCSDKLTFGKDNKCVIYSLGSNNQFDFEQEMKRLFPKCTIHTFDCTGDWKDPSTTYHKWCIGAKDEVDSLGRQFKRVSTISKELGVETVSLLKMDIENFEWGFFLDLLNEPAEDRPKQVLVEFHGGMPIDKVPVPWKIAPSFFEGWNDNWAIPVARMVKLFGQLGYRIAFQERNRWGDFATEIILLHETAL